MQMFAYSCNIKMFAGKVAAILGALYNKFLCYALNVYK